MPVQPAHEPWRDHVLAWAEKASPERRAQACRSLRAAQAQSVLQAVSTSFRQSDEILRLWPALLGLLAVPLPADEAWPERSELVGHLVAQIGHHLQATPTIPNARAQRVMEATLPRLPTLTTPQLVALAQAGLEGLRTALTGAASERGSSPVTRALPFLAQILALLPARSRVEDETGGPPSSGSAYRARWIRSVCGLAWRAEWASAWASLFPDLELSAEEFEAVQDRLGQLMPGVPPAELPPLVHQMLRLTQGPHASLPLLTALARYFRSRLENASPQDSEDLIEGDAQIGAVKQAEGTTLYHITSAIKRGHPMGKDILKALRGGTHLPEVILTPFTTYLALALTSIKPLALPIVDSLKSTVLKNTAFKLRRQTDAWFRKASEDMASPSDIFRHLLEQVANNGGWDLIERGFLDLAMALLDSSAGFGRPDKKVRLLWAVGEDMLCHMIKRFPHTLEAVIRLISKRILAARNAPQYTDGLQKVVKAAGWSLSENAMMVNDLLEQTSNLGLVGARRVLSALLPLIQVSRALRNTTILVLRKALFSRSIEVKQIGLNGVIQMLKSFKISSSLPITQMSQSSSGLSQISVDVHRGGSPSNEALCLELLGVLRRGLGQHASVRLSLYQGILEVIGRNPELSANILEILSQHPIMVQALSKSGQAQGAETEDDVALLDLDLALLADNNTPSIRDPIGWYLHCIQQLITKIEVIYGEDTENLDDNGLKDKMTDFLNDLSRKYANADLVDLNLAKEADYTRQSPEGETNVNKIEVLKNVYESLMDFTITHGADVSEEKASTLVRLFKGHQSVQALLKTTGNKPTGGKKEPGKRKVDQGGEPKKVAHGSQFRKPASQIVFKNPEHALSLSSLCILLKACLLDQLPAHQSALNAIRQESGCLGYFFKVVNEKQALWDRTLALRGNEGEGSDAFLLSQTIFKHLTSLGRLLVQHCLFNVEAEESLLHPGLECLARNLELITKHFERKLLAYLNGLGLTSDGSNQPLLELLLEGIFAKITSVQDHMDDFDNAPKMIGLLFGLGSTLIHQLKLGAPTCENSLKKVNDWTRKYGESSSMSDPNVLKPFLNLLFLSNRMFKPNSGLELDIAREIHSKLGDLNETLQTDEEKSFGFISKESGEVVLQSLIVSLESSLDSADIVIARSKQQFSSEPWNSGDSEGNAERLAESEKMMCQLLARSINTYLELSQSGLQLGALLDQLLKSLAKLYTSLDNLAKYFFVRSKSDKEAVLHSKFDKLVEIAKNLTKHLYELINHVEKKARDAAEENNLSRKKADSALRTVINKEARTIPNLIFRIEQFENDLIKISSRCKIDFKLKASISRDFRMDTGKLSPDETTGHDPASDSAGSEEDEDGSRHNAESTRIGESQPTEAEDARDSPSSSQASILAAGHLEPPPSKKLKVKWPASRPS